MSEYYVSLPNDSQLSPAQRKAITDTNAIALSGGPGTGKSIVSLLRHITNHSLQNKKISELLTFTTSLALYLKKCTEKQNLSAAGHVNSAKDWKFNHASSRDEIIMDEAQDLALAFNQGLSKISKQFSYGADDQQLITSNSRNSDGSYNLDRCSCEAALHNIFTKNTRHALSKNYRNSKRIMNFTKSVFQDAWIPLEILNSCKEDGEFPRWFSFGNDLQKQNNTILSIVKQYNLNSDTNTAILLPFENKNSIAGVEATVAYYHKLLADNNIDCSVYTNSMSGCKAIKNVHVTTFKSSKGLEFDNVIIPVFHYFQNIFQVITWRDYYVGVTRAKSNLFIFSKNHFSPSSSSGNDKVYEKVVL